MASWAPNAKNAQKPLYLTIFCSISTICGKLGYNCSSLTLIIFNQSVIFNRIQNLPFINKFALENLKKALGNAILFSCAVWENRQRLLWLSKIRQWTIVDQVSLFVRKKTQVFTLCNFGMNKADTDFNEIGFNSSDFKVYCKLVFVNCKANFCKAKLLYRVKVLQQPVSCIHQYLQSRSDCNWTLGFFD